MKSLIKEYRSWLAENREFYEEIKNHNSSLFHRFQPIYTVLDYLYKEQMNNKGSVDDDIEKIFQVGLEYLNMQFFTCKLYLEKTFNQNFHSFLQYDNAIGYLLFLEDLEYELVEKKANYDKVEFEKLKSYLADIIEKRKDLPENLSLYLDSRIHQIITENYEFTGIIDIFVDIAETLEIDLEDNDLEYILGDDFDE